MKKYLFLTVCITIFGYTAAADNGGGAIVCRNKKGKVTYAELYDLWEHRRLGISNRTKIEQETTSKNIAEFIAYLESWYPQLTVALEIEIIKIENAIHDSNKELVELPEIPETEITLVEFPARCPINENATATYEALITFTGDTQIDVSSALLHNRPKSTIDALVLRAASYNLFRLKFNLIDTRAARAFTGIAASSKSRSQKRALLEQLFNANHIVDGESK